MKIKIEKKYLLLPIGHYAHKKRIEFFQDNTLIFDVDAELDFITPDYVSYLDMQRFIGKTVDIKITPYISFPYSLKQADETDDTGIYEEKERPQFHFSAKRGWINDPNGLVYYRGKYHMFFQHNPIYRFWGNMQWGHAVSDDLVHWEQKDTAIFPDETGIVASGSGIVDTKNLTGLKNGDHDPILLFFSSGGDVTNLAKGKPWEQHIAYSLDGGETFVRYAKNPIVKAFVWGNRDPKIIYCDELTKYLMIFYYNNNEYQIMTSDNLLDWNNFDRIAIEGDCECPDLYPLYLDGDKNKRLWILTGAADRFVIGTFENGKLKLNNPAKPLRYGNWGYASQSFSNIPEDDGRRIRISWNNQGSPLSIFNNCMNIPTEMSLKTICGREHLCTYPVSEFSTLYEKTETINNVELLPCEIFSHTLDTAAGYDVNITLKAEENSNIEFSIFGLSFSCSINENALKIWDQTAPLYAEDGQFTLRFIFDRSCFEIFVDKGQAYLCGSTMPDFNINRLTVCSNGGNANIISAQISKVKSIWK